LIDRVFLDRGQSPPETDVSKAMAASWEEHLTHANVPTDLFGEVYQEAMSAYDNQGPFGITELLHAWPAVRTRTDAKLAQQERDGANCQRCFGTGMEIVPNGNYQESRRCNHQPLIETEPVR
jgi:hypothetical protein